MSEHKQLMQIESASNKSFGFTFAIIFLLLSVVPVFKNHSLWSIHIPILSVALILTAITLFAPNSLEKPNQLWNKLGLLLGAIVAPLVMGSIYLLIITPTGLIMRLKGRALLDTLPQKTQSYWIKRDKPLGRMEDQF